MKKLILLSLLSLFLMNISVAAEGGEDRKAQSGDTVTIIMENCTFTFPITRTSDLQDLKNFVTRHPEVKDIKFSTDTEMGPFFNNRSAGFQEKSAYHCFSSGERNFIIFSPIELVCKPRKQWAGVPSYHYSPRNGLSIICSFKDPEMVWPKNIEGTETGLGIINFFISKDLPTGNSDLTKENKFEEAFKGIQRSSLEEAGRVSLHTRVFLGDIFANCLLSLR